MILFSPGPSNISERVRNSLLAPDIGHREPEFGTLLTDVRQGIRQVVGLAPDAAYDVVLLGGSGSVAIESVVAAARPLGRMLVIANGPYGERAAAMARHHGTEVEEWCLAWGEEISLEILEAKLRQASYGAVYVVHHETATGRLNPLREIAGCAKAHNVLVLSDTVSSIVGEPIDIADWGLDAVIGSANKCIRGIPGAAFVITSRAFRAAANAQQTPHYSNLALHAFAQEAGEFPFTPPVHAMFALREALLETLDEGVAVRQLHYRTLMHRTMAALEALDLPMLLPRDAYGRTLVSCQLPAGWTYDALHDPLKRAGYCIYAAQGALKSSAFRLGIIGHFGSDAVDGLFREMRIVLGR
ncbi:MAG: alanine--glyoxylate aminotransferase family protein [Phycisphaerae bacterium]|nr:alanine--glyoxylate aminotransferase family protein [Gemmatimonadaceae bacterium]